MDDEAQIRVEPGATGTGAWHGQEPSSRRVVHQPTRRTRLAAAAVLAGLVVGGVALSQGGRGGDDRPQEPALPEEPNDAYVAAVARLGQARTFAYRGEVHATERSALRPGNWLDDEVTVHGAVLLPRSISHEVALAGDRAVETVTSGPTAWSRAASSRSGLSDVRWERVAWYEQGASLPSAPNSESLGSGRLGITRIVDVLRATEARRPGPADDEGNRVLVATVSEDGNHLEQVGDLAGAQAVLAIDDAGDITGVKVVAGPADDPVVAVDLTIVKLGEPGLITPAEIGRPVRDAVDTAEVRAAGVHPLEPSRLPAGWALTDAGVSITEPAAHCGTGDGSGGCELPPGGCAVFALVYQDLAAVSEGELLFSVRSDGCFADSPGAGPASSATAGGEAFLAGRFSGWVDELGAGTTRATNGVVADGETIVSFSTDLSADDARAVLATLVPFDAATEPAVLPGVPSS